MSRCRQVAFSSSQATSHHFKHITKIRLLLEACPANTPSTFCIYTVVMTSNLQTLKPSRSLAKGLIAGFLGGLAGAAAKAVAEKVYPPRKTVRTHGQPYASPRLTEGAGGQALTHTQQAIADDSIHWTFGPLMGAAYGALAEFAPIITDRHGVTFGVALCSLTKDGTLPGLGASSLNADNPMQEKSSEMVSHTAYGVVTETVRRTLRRIL